MNLVESRQQPGSRWKLRRARRQRTNNYYKELQRWNDGNRTKEPTLCLNCRYSICRCGDEVCI